MPEAGPFAIRVALAVFYFLFGYGLPERRSQHSSLSQSPLNPASLNYPYLCVCHQVASQMFQNTSIAVHAYFFRHFSAARYAPLRLIG